MSPTMRAWQTSGQGVGRMRFTQRPVPEPGPGEVLVEVRVRTHPRGYRGY